MYLDMIPIESHEMSQTIIYIDIKISRTNNIVYFQIHTYLYQSNFKVNLKTIERQGRSVTGCMGLQIMTVSMKFMTGLVTTQIRKVTNILHQLLEQITIWGSRNY